MPWCPACKNEYVEGMTHCPDCDVDLVDELSENDDPQRNAALQIPEDYEFPEDFDPRTAMAAIAAGDTSEPKEKTEPAKSYKSPEDRYSDMHSSAWTFLLVGFAGIVFMILCWLDIVQLPVYDFVLLVMTGLFLIFLLVGVVSFRSAQNLKANIASENAFMSEIIHWYRTTGCNDPSLLEIDPDQPEELLYFQRSERIQSLLKEKFPEIDQALLEKLTDDFCEENFTS